MLLQKWFFDYYIVLNWGKCYYITFGLNTTKNEFVLEDVTIAPSGEEHVVLGITIDFCLTFYFHLKQLCKKVTNKLNTLTKIDSYFTHNQRQLIYSSFLSGQLSYWPLIWTFCFRQSSYLINKLQDQDLRIIYKNYDSSFSAITWNVWWICNSHK